MKLSPATIRLTSSPPCDSSHHKKGSGVLFSRLAVSTGKLLCTSRQYIAITLAILILYIAAASPLHAQQAASIQRPILPQAKQTQLDLAADLAITWLIAHQNSDGSFSDLDTPKTAQPALTSLAALAILSRKHQPAKPAYDKSLDKAIRFILTCQRKDGLISLAQPTDSSMQVVWYQASHTAIYNHAISSLLLSEVFGQTDPSLNKQINLAIQRALEFTLKQYPVPKRKPRDNGGWRYLAQAVEGDGDISVTSWQLMFLRSAKNAGFTIPAATVDLALQFIDRCYDEQLQSFLYMPSDPRTRYSRATAAAGILSLSLGGRHNTPRALTAGNWLINQPLIPYNTPLTPTDRYHYSLFYASAATYQLGGHHFTKYYPKMVNVLLQNQKPDGAWQRESHGNRVFGQTLTTSLAILALTIPDETLPIFQR